MMYEHNSFPAFFLSIVWLLCQRWRGEWVILDESIVIDRFSISLSIGCLVALGCAGISYCKLKVIGAYVGIKRKRLMMLIIQNPSADWLLTIEMKFWFALKWCGWILSGSRYVSFKSSIVPWFYREKFLKIRVQLPQEAAWSDGKSSFTANKERKLLSTFYT